MSRSPVDNISTSTKFQGSYTTNEVKAPLDGSIKQSTNGESWQALVNTISSCFEETENQMLYKTPTKNYTISEKDLKKSQTEDPSISRIIELKQSGSLLTENQRRQETKEVRSLIRGLQKLFIGENGLLYRKSQDNFNQLVLSLQYRKVVYNELHVQMDHLEPDRTYQLARQRFYWPNMEEDISHFVSNVCHCVKQKKPNTV